MCARWNRLIEAVLTSVHGLCFGRKCEKYQNFLSENFHFLVYACATSLSADFLFIFDLDLHYMDR